MKPFKAKDFINEVKGDIPEDIAKLIINDFWSVVRTSLSSLDHNRVHISNLGDFVIKPWSVVRYLERLDYTSLKYPNDSKILERTEEKRQLILKVKDMIEQEKQRKDFIKFHKKENNVEENKLKSGLEE